MDILLKLVASEQVSGIDNVISWLRDAGLIRKLVQKFDPELAPDAHANASLALIDIMSTTQSIQRLHIIMGEIKRYV